MKTNAKKRGLLMGLSLMLLIISTLRTEAQFSYIPTNATAEVLIQNDEGMFLSSWVTASSDSAALGGRILVLTHGTYFDSSSNIKQIVSRYVYRQVGAYYFLPLGGEDITVFGVNRRAPGGWIATTNTILATDMFEAFWNPPGVGTLTTVSGLRRTIETYSPVEYWCKNIASRSELLLVGCVSNGAGFYWKLHFKPDEIKVFTIDLKSGRYHRDGNRRLSFFTINPEFTSDDPNF